MKTTHMICAGLLAAAGCSGPAEQPISATAPAAQGEPAPDLGVLGTPSSLASSDPVKRAVELYDKNGNGVLDPDERAAVKERVEKRRQWRRQTILSEFDADSDGVLNSGELESFRVAEETRKAQKKAIVLARFDRDGNGIIDPAEKAEQRGKVAALVAQARAEALRRWDRNRNGVLDMDEEEAMRASIEQRRVRKPR